MKKYGYFLHTILPAALLSSSVMAQPPAAGYQGSVPGIKIGCDTLEQVKAIYEAGKTDIDAFGAKFKEFADQKDSDGDPSCVVGAIPVSVTITEVVPLGPEVLDGHPEHFWAVHVTVGKSDWWLMDEELDAKVEGTSI